LPRASWSLTLPHRGWIRNPFDPCEHLISNLDLLQSVERRHAVRYELRIPVVFSWKSAGDRKCRGEGVTRDISEVGVYVFTATCPAPESKVRIEILMAQPGFASASLKGRMQVLRVEEGPETFGGCGFALAGKQFSLRSAVRA
jgi:hypothetical protein